MIQQVGWLAANLDDLGLIPEDPRSGEEKEPLPQIV